MDILVNFLKTLGPETLEVALVIIAVLVVLVILALLGFIGLLFHPEKLK